ncbi:MAG: ABC transporter ATP-binding protein [Pseudomonadota bacterium]
MTPEAPSSTDVAASAQGLSVHLGGRSILKDISLSVPAGSVVGLVGRNGAGKSTLLRSLVGLVEPSSGSSELLGCPSLHLTDAVRERLGFVAQTPDLFEWMGVLEMLQTIGRAYPCWDERRALALAVQLELPLGGSVRNLSGGDQQKLSVVLAMAHNPDLLLLDEPVSSLDPMTRRDFMRALFTSPLRADNDRTEPVRERTALISSHLLADLERVVTHVAFIRDGRLQWFDAWDAMQEHLRLVPPVAANDKSRGVTRSLVWTNRQSGCRVVDTRLDSAWAGAGRSLLLDELFLELNA